VRANRSTAGAGAWFRQIARGIEIARSSGGRRMDRGSVASPPSEAMAHADKENSMLQLRTFMVITALIWVAASACALEEGDVTEPIQSTEDVDAYQELDTAVSPDSEQHEAIDVDDMVQEMRRNEGDADCGWCAEGTVYQCCVNGPEGRVCNPPSC
jgi:hypothetical protein